MGNICEVFVELFLSNNHGDFATNHTKEAALMMCYKLNADFFNNCCPNALI